MSTTSDRWEQIAQDLFTTCKYAFFNYYINIRSLISSKHFNMCKMCAALFQLSFAFYDCLAWLFGWLLTMLLYAMLETYTLTPENSDNKDSHLNKPLKLYWMHHFPQFFHPFLLLLALSSFSASTSPSPFNLRTDICVTYLWRNISLRSSHAGHWNMVVSVFGRSVWCGSSNLGVNMQLQQLHPKQLNTIVPTLLGYWFESPTSALVYEYLVNGYLNKFLFAEKEVGQFLRYPLKFIEVSMDHVLIYQCARRAFETRPQQPNQIDIYTPPMVATSWMNWVFWGDETVNIWLAFHRHIRQEFLHLWKKELPEGGFLLWALNIKNSTAEQPAVEWTVWCHCDDLHPTSKTILMETKYKFTLALNQKY